MAQTMCFHERMVLLGVGTMGNNVIWGNMPSKPHKMGMNTGTQFQTKMPKYKNHNVSESTHQMKTKFLPHCMQCRRGLAMRILSVRLSLCPFVCPSHAWIVTKQ